MKVSSVSMHSPSDWFLVADSYAHLADMDSARAVIIRLTDCEENTVRAIECEMACDWERAFSYYRFTNVSIFLVRFLKINVLADHSPANRQRNEKQRFAKSIN